MIEVLWIMLNVSGAFGILARLFEGLSLVYGGVVVSEVQGLEVSNSLSPHSLPLLLRIGCYRSLGDFCTPCSGCRRVQDNSI